MRILMLNNEFPPLGGGTATVNLMLFKQFAESPDLQIDLVTASRGKAYEEEQFAPNIRIYKVPVNNINIHHATNRELIAYTLRGYRKADELCRRKPSELCMAWSALPAGVIADALKKRRGLPFIIRVGGTDIPGFEKRYRRLYPFLTPFIRHAWKQAETVVVKCRTEQEMILAVDCHPRITTIPNGVDLEAFGPVACEEPAGPLRLVSVGRLIPRKGYPLVFRALKTLLDQGRRITLDLIGTGDAHEGYVRHVSELGIDHAVTFRGYVPREQLPELYRNAHAFVLASENEGMSISTLEALASGLALVVSRTGGTEELVKQGKNGFIFPVGDEASLTTHLRTLASNRALVMRMGQASRAHARQFSWRRIADCYYDLFRSLPAGTRPHKGQ